VTLPLTGFRVLDMGDEATVLASRLLADLGADVVRVESAGGDAVRSRPPFAGDTPGVERSLAHLLYNAGKRSLALDLERPESWRLVGLVLQQCDVAIAPLEKRPLAAGFFSPEHISNLTSRTGVVDAVFRRNAPDELATDLIGTASGGLLYLNGYPDDPPNKPAGQLAYKQVSLAAALAAVSMILEQAASGSGGRVTVCMQEAVMWTTIQSANENYWYWHRARPERRGLSNLGGQTIFQARDGGWVSFYQHPPAWPAFVAWVAESLGDRRFEAAEWEDQLYRLEHQAEVTSVTAMLCKRLNRDNLVAEAQRRAILVVPVQSVADIAQDPHLRARGFFQEVWHEQLGRAIETYRSPFVSSAYEVIARPAPALGQHSREILGELCGLDEHEIDHLAKDGVVGTSERVVS
jgi:benzylsuccinate CoA-transferase BbsE subunit